MTHIMKRLPKGFDQKGYEDFLAAVKKLDMPVKVNTEKKNHPSSLYTELPIKSSHPFGNNKFTCEVRNKNVTNYSLQLSTDKLESRIACRLDEGDGTHRNKYKDIALEKQFVPTPHIHKYDAQGRWMAYPIAIPSLQGCLPIDEGFNIFCKEFCICSENGQKGICVQEDGEIPFPYDDDPLNGINF